MTVYFDLSFQNQTINPSVGTYSSGDGVTPSFELVDNEYYLKNVGSHGYYHFNIANIPNDTVIEFDLIFNNKYTFSWIFLFESTNSNWWGIYSNHSDLQFGGYNLSDLILASNITNGTKYHVTLISQYNILGNTIKIYLNNNLVASTIIATTYERSQFLLLGNTVNYTANCYIKDILVTDLSTDTTKYLNGTGLSEVWTNTKNYISAQLLGKSDVGHTHSDYVPRSGGAVLSGNEFYRTVNDSTLAFRGGNRYDRGGGLVLFGKDATSYGGAVDLVPRTSTTAQKDMLLYPNGTWTWEGTAVQLISDQRLKQQISNIDDKLLDAWEDVNPVQFKYNDAVEEKSDNARLHTGYVVQQIDEACKSHNVDISAYGLYCHEEYPQEVEEVEIEQADGTKTKETKVIREASEHYSLRYTEALVVECKYLRRCIARLTARIEELEKGNNTK